jgi:PAS domain S-box-containing protein
VKGWRIRTYMAWLVILVVAASAAGAFYVRTQSRQDALDDARSEAAYAAKTAAKPLAEGISTLQSLLSQVSGSDSGQLLQHPEDCTLSYVKIGAFSTGHIDVLRADGSVACSSRPGQASSLPSYAGADWLPRALGAPQFLAPVVDKASGAPAVLFSGNFTGGAVVALIDLRSIGPDLTAEFGGPHAMEFLVTTADGSAVLARSIDPARWVGAPLRNTAFARAASKEVRPDLSGAPRIYQQATVTPSGWKVYAGASEDAALAAANELFNRDLLVIGGTLLVVLLAAMVIQRRINGPIRKLGDAVRGAAPGAGAAPIAVRGPAEVNALAADFNGMIATVAQELAERRRAETAARAAEESLRESEQTYRMLFESHPLPMYFYDLETLAFLEVNDAAVLQYGWSRAQFLTMTIKDIRPEADIPALLAAIATSSNHGEEAAVTRSGPWRHRRSDGSLIEVEITSHVIEMGGRMARFVIAEDVSERERLQHQLQQSHRLESLGQLAGGVAHDFNNLLAVIMNYTAFVKEEAAAAAAGDPQRWEPVRQDVEQIELASVRASRLVHQLLAFARREVTRPAVLDLNSVVADVEQLLRRSLGEHVQLSTTAGPGLWPVLADAGQLEQVLVNLAVNGRDAMPRGGTLSIETDNLEVDADYASSRPGLSPGRYVRLRVSDTGVGMERAVVERAFEPFFTTKPKGEGTGLGLATIYGVLTQAGGYVQIYSEPGLGTTVTALLPATDRSVSSNGHAPAALAQPADGTTVLVVEDEEAIREVARRILSRNGYRVITAGSGAEALEVAASYADSIDLLLTDVVMPQMLGKEVAERVGALRPGIRVLFMSGYAQNILGVQGALSPEVVLVEKPFTERALLAKVARVLDHAVL